MEVVLSAAAEEDEKGATAVAAAAEWGEGTHASDARPVHNRSIHRKRGRKMKQLAVLMMMKRLLT
ncbi:hypothetical protein PJI17_31935, partial [Mycobacterium kansasii]